MLGLSYFACVFFLARLFIGYHDPLIFDLLFENFNLGHKHMQNTFFECSASLKFLLRQKIHCQSWNLWRGPFWLNQSSSFVRTNFYFVLSTFILWDQILCRSNEFHLVGKNFISCEHILFLVTNFISWKRILFGGNEFFFLRTQKYHWKVASETCLTVWISSCRNSACWNYYHAWRYASW
jgi:hypothetical protein